MSLHAALDRHARRVAPLAPLGHAVMLHVRRGLPLTVLQTWPEPWAERYATQGYALRDPLIGWGLSVTGSQRWSDLRALDAFGVLADARRHGLSFGLVVAVGPATSRSIAAAARADREFTAAERESFAASVEALHQATEPPAALTAPQAEALALVGAGHRYAAAAAQLGITESALKARLAAGRRALQARTTAEAVRRARDLRLI